MEEKTLIKQIKKYSTPVHKTSKFLVFFGLIYAATILYRLGDKETSTTLLILLGIYVLFSKIDAMERKQKEISNESTSL